MLCSKAANKYVNNIDKKIESCSILKIYKSIHHVSLAVMQTFFDLNQYNLGSNYHRVKSVRIRSFFGPYFAAFGLNTERYFLSLRIQSECGKIRTRTTWNKYLPIRTQALCLNGVFCGIRFLKNVKTLIFSKDSRLKFNFGILQLGLNNL